MWLFYLIAVFILLILIWKIVKYIKMVPPPPQDTFYFQVEDEDKNLSIVHDSGIQPSKTKPGDMIHLDILKSSYTEGKKINISTPNKLYLGMNPKNLKSIKIDYVTTEDLLYNIFVVAPENPFYENGYISPIDQRVEIPENES